MKDKKRILVFGAGVIGSIYGGRLALKGHNVTFFARNERLKKLEMHGLCLHEKGKKEPVSIKVNVISELLEDDIYDFIFVAIRKDNIMEALPILSKNKSQNIVFMVNNSSGYSDWVAYLGPERLIPAFPGCGGKLANGVVHYEIVSGLIQSTTLGETNGKITERAKILKSIISNAGFPVCLSKRMDAWQKTHIAMVAPIAYAIYYDGGDNYSTAKNKTAIDLMNRAIKENFLFLKSSGVGIVPAKLSIISFMPLSILNPLMRFVFNTNWAETVICNHAKKAKHEMELLSLEFLVHANQRGYKLISLTKLLNQCHEKDHCSTCTN